MTIRGARYRFLTGTAAAVFVCISGGVTAQDAAGLQADLSFAQGLTFSDTDGTYGLTELGFGLSSTTRMQSLELSISGALRQDLDDGLTLETEDPRLTLSYGIESRQTALTTNLSYSRSDADAFVEDVDGLPGVLVLDEGTRENSSASVGLTFGREARFGGSFNLGYSDLSYSDTTSTDLVDTQTVTAGLNFEFEIDPRITATLGYNRSDIDRATNRDTVTERLTAGAQFEVTQSLNANLSIGQSRTAVTDAGVETITEGLTYGIDLTQARPRGELRFSLNSSVSENGRRTTATVGTTYEMRRGEINASFGLSEGTDNTIRPVATLAYSEELQRGSYSISLDQDFSTTSDGDETLNSRLRLNWQQDLTRAARISSSLTYQVTDVLGADEDTSRLALGLGYSRDLTDDWAVTTRFSHSIVDEDGSATERENDLFIGLETTFAWRP